MVRARSSAPSAPLCGASVDQSLALITAAVTCGLFALVGILYARRQRTDADGFTTAAASAGIVRSATSLVALCAGTWVLSSPGETATWAGLPGLVGYALGSAAPLLILAWLGPALVRRYPGAPSIGLMARARWGVPAQLLVSVIAVTYMAVYMCADLTAVSTAGKALAGLDPAVIAVLVAATTLTYAVWGGLRATIFTDAVQFWFVLPLLAMAAVAAVSALGGWEAAQQPLLGHPLMEPLASMGVGMGLCLLIAIPAANLFDQSQWQRVVACADTRTVRWAFSLAALGMAVVVLGAGWFGLWYAAHGMDPATANSALLVLIASKTPLWAVLGVLALAMILVMSTLGSLANGIASVVANDLASLRPATTPGQRLWTGRLVTALAALIAVPIAAQQPSVTYVFLVADLLCAAAVIPVFAGLAGWRLSAPGLFIATAAGLVAGGVCFPDSVYPANPLLVDLRPWLGLPADLNTFLVSFALAIAVSGLVALGIRIAAPARR